MPVSVEVDGETKTAHVVGEGRLAVGEILSALRPVWQDPKHHPGCRLLVDLRLATMSSWSRVELDTTLDFAKGVAPAPREGRAAVVVAEDVDYGLVRMLLAYRGVKKLSAPDGGWGEMEVFRDFGEARRWLSEEALQPSEARAD